MQLLQVRASTRWQIQTFIALLIPQSRFSCSSSTQRHLFKYWITRFVCSLPVHFLFLISRAKRARTLRAFNPAQLFMFQVTASAAWKFLVLDSSAVWSFLAVHPPTSIWELCAVCLSRFLELDKSFCFMFHPGANYNLCMASSQHVHVGASVNDANLRGFSGDKVISGFLLEISLGNETIQVPLAPMWNAQNPFTFLKQHRTFGMLVSCKLIHRIASRLEQPLP